MLDVSDERATDGAETTEDLGGERGPVRTCVGCRQRAQKDELLRLAIVPTDLRERGPAVLVDPTGRLPGRGLHVHPTAACVAAAVERGGIARSVKGAPGITTMALRTAMTLKLDARVDGLLGGARRARKLAIGTDAVRAEIDTCSALIVAAGSVGRAAELSERASARGIPVVSFGDEERLGALMRGRGTSTAAGSPELADPQVGVVAILDSGIAAEVVRTLARVAQLQVAGGTPRDVSEAR